ncbi:MAG TPA: N-acetylmuramoyl-L-alanine amidase [Gemmatimonadales bacterium]|nr:N-acetylmuramoyl-L-alanine amidase [Gemmatimonadales bacterium]
MTLWALVIGLAPAQIVIATPRGQTIIPVTTERGAAAVAAPLLSAPLGLTSVTTDSQTTLTLDGLSFAVQIGVPFARVGAGFCNLAGEPYVARDTLFLPLPFLSECVPQALPRYRWEPAAGRLVETRPTVLASAPPDTDAPVVIHPRPHPPLPPNPMTGLRLHHVVAVDPGHGGVDPGAPKTGGYLPRGQHEKDITFAIARILKSILTDRGIEVDMTRTSDTLISLYDRPYTCVDACDLFVSIHVNSMDEGPNRSKARGVETYYLETAKTEDASRVAKLENDAIRYEQHTARGNDSSPLKFINQDMVQNEYLRESARLAELIQGRVGSVVPGGDRGVQQAPFWVLKDARRPAVLVETGFATNRGDAEFLGTGAGQQKIALAIADGIVAYLRELERKTAVPGAAR